jgi:hypothetical protein
MPERELPRHLRQQLSALLEDGAPLAAPLPSQARYSRLREPMLTPRWRLRALTVAVAIAGIVLVGLAGPQQPREWFIQSVNDITKQVGVPAGSSSPSPSTGAQGHKESPETTESPEANEPSETGQTPEAGESPEPAQSPDGGDRAQASPTPEQHDGGGDGGGGGGGDGDHSPEPSPSSGD